MYVCSVSVNIIFRLVSLANIMNQKAKVKSFFGSATKSCVFAEKQKNTMVRSYKKKKTREKYSQVFKFSIL